MDSIGRRDFLKVMGVAGAGAVSGRPAESSRTLVPFLIPPEDIIPGVPNWYATTCRECPAGCGMLAKNLDGRVIKLEGNPRHPVNRGALCARGQAALQGLYDPDRFPGPMGRTTPQAPWKPVSWDDGLSRFAAALSSAASRGSGRIALVTDLLTGTLADIAGVWCSAFGSPGILMWEPLGCESLRAANGAAFGREALPLYRVDRADFLISFGADFLETWLSNVEYARLFAEFRALSPRGKNPFVYVGPRLSLTAANADEWVAVPPGREHFVALGMVRAVLEAGNPGLDAGTRAALAETGAGMTVEVASERSGVHVETIRRLALRFAAAKKPLALAGGLSLSDPEAHATAIAANLLTACAPGATANLDFSAASALSACSPASALKTLSERMARGEVDVLCILSANPAFTFPPAFGFSEAARRVPLVVTLSPAPDETAALAHLALPAHTPLEMWGDTRPRPTVSGLLQPVTARLHDTRHPGDVFLAAARLAGRGANLPAGDFSSILREAWRSRHLERNLPGPFEAFWVEAVRHGGWFEEGSAAPPPAVTLRRGLPPPKSEGPPRAEGTLPFAAFPTVQFHDGRGARHPWLQELPDPMTMITWGAWVEIHPETARELGIAQGEVLSLSTPHGAAEAPALLFPGVAPGVIAMPIGQGHTAFGRFALDNAGNPLSVFPPRCGPGGGLSAPRITLRKTGRTAPIAHTDGNPSQLGRGLSQVMSLERWRQAVSKNQKPLVRLPLPEGHDPATNLYPPHGHIAYRWAMAVDLDRCIGCGACAVACQAENNIPWVGPLQIRNGREMSWLRIERYLDDERPAARFLPMLCQHCDQAPCESVCPVYAPHHNAEGLNVQVYNRCFGTRFCSQNCPYKVRRFNWFSYPRPEPMPLQLNPDVTVREKGVMEKCSFCIQRIVAAKIRARAEGRTLRDGEVTPACVETCPTGALAFGSLLDRGSRVFQLFSDPRAYQVLSHLGTRPAVVYLKRVTQEVIAP